MSESITQYVYSGIAAYRDGHYHMAVGHFLSARSLISRSRVMSPEVILGDMLRRLYWLKCLASTNTSKRSQRRLLWKIMRPSRHGLTIKYRAACIYYLGRRYNEQDSLRHIDRDLQRLAS